MKQEPEPKAAPIRPRYPLYVSDDGYVRIPLAALRTLRFTHFLSGLDDDCPEHCVEGGCIQSISGYTEWLTDTDPTITVGWDWCLDLTGTTPAYVRHGLPRTNLMARDDNLPRDLGDLRTGTLLAALIDRLDWQSVVRHNISIRYSWQ